MSLDSSSRTRGRARSLFLVLALLSAAPLPARELSRVARFHSLHAVPAAPVAVDAAGRDLEGLEVRIENGRIDLRVARMTPERGITIEGFSLAGRFPEGGDLVTRPVSSVAEALFAESDFRIAKLDSGGVAPTLKNLTVSCRDGRFVFTGKKLTTFSAEGKLALVPEPLTLVVELEKVKAGIVPVPLRVVFAALAKVLKVPGVEIDAPRILVDLGSRLR